MSLADKLPTFASEASPLRASLLNTLASCPLQTLLKAYSVMGEDESGAPADTGSALGRMIELYHAGMSVRESLDTTSIEAIGRGGKPGKYPRADLASCARILNLYCADPTNQPYSVAFDCERKVTCRLPGFTPGEPEIVIPGHIDQARAVTDGSAEVEINDVKNGQGRPHKMTGAYAWQLSAYVVGYQQATGKRTRLGHIIRTQSYTQTSNGSPFVYLGWSYEECLAILDSARFLISNIRRGLVAATPGEHCSWCPALNPRSCANLKL